MNRDTLKRTLDVVALAASRQRPSDDAHAIVSVLERELNALNGYSTHETYHLALVIDSDERLAEQQREVVRNVLDNLAPGAEPMSALSAVAGVLLDWCEEIVQLGPVGESNGYAPKGYIEHELPALAQAMLRLALDGVDWHAYATRAIELEVDDA